MKSGSSSVTSSPKPSRPRSASIFSAKPKSPEDPMGFLIGLGVEPGKLGVLLQNIIKRRDSNPEGKLTAGDITYINFEFKKILGDIEMAANEKLTSILLKVISRSMEREGFKSFMDDDPKKISQAFFRAIAGDPALKAEFDELIEQRGKLADNYKDAYASFLGMANVKNTEAVMAVFHVEESQASKQEEQKLSPLEVIRRGAVNTAISGKIKSNQDIVRYDIDANISPKRQAEFAQLALELKSIDPSAPDANERKMAIQKRMVHTMISPEDFRQATIASFGPFMAGRYYQDEKIAKLINEGNDDELRKIIRAEIEKNRTAHGYGEKLKKEVDKSLMFPLKVMCFEHSVKLDLRIYESNDLELKHLNTEMFAYVLSSEALTGFEAGFLGNNKIEDLLLNRFKQTFAEQNKALIKDPDALVPPVPLAPSLEETQGFLQRRDDAKARLEELAEREKTAKAVKVQEPDVLQRLQAVTTKLEEHSPQAPRITVSESPSLPPRQMDSSPSVPRKEKGPFNPLLMAFNRGRSKSVSTEQAPSLSSAPSSPQPLRTSSDEVQATKDHLKGLDLFHKKDSSKDDSSKDSDHKKLGKK
ncbi:MAG: hypothetical protein JSR17_04975 [Proteobacteria bacterium]|nr:hypothetical protein [Pseudomonadota bacterium]